MKTLKTKIVLLIITIAICSSQAKLPVAIFHGVGDSCSNGGMNRITKYFGAQLDGVYTKCIESAGGVADWSTSFLTQAKKACNEVRSDPNYAGDFSVVGLSQGALIARYIVQACDMPGTVKRYVSIGGPQMGVAKFPHCGKGPVCGVVNFLVGKAIYASFIQNSIGPAGYFKVPTEYETYLNSSVFLADLNNEKSEKNPKYKQKFSKLESVVLIKFSNDNMILPKETAWFQYYDQKMNVIDYTETEFYKQDFIGLKQLVEGNKVNFYELPGDHLNFDNEDIDEYMIPHLK